MHAHAHLAAFFRRDAAADTHPTVDDMNVSQRFIASFPFARDAMLSIPDRMRLADARFIVSWNNEQTLRDVERREVGDSAFRACVAAD